MFSSVLVNNPCVLSHLILCFVSGACVLSHLTLCFVPLALCFVTLLGTCIRKDSIRKIKPIRKALSNPAACGWQGGAMACSLPLSLKGSCQQEEDV